MKNFLKSTALFACIAMMFCACSEDTTEDVAVSGSVPAAVIENIQPGQGTIVLEWYIQDNCDVDKSVITWKNLDVENSSSNGVTNVTIEKDDWSYSYTIGADFPLEVGSYEVTVTNVYSYALQYSTPVSETVLVYTYDTYKDSMPVPTGYTHDATTGVTIEWSDIIEDCQGVVLTYTYVDAEGEDAQKTTDLMPLTDGTTTLEDAKVGTSYTYKAYFCPSTAIDMVEVSMDDEGNEYTAVISSTPGSSETFSVLAGVERFCVEWDLTEEVLADDLVAMLVKYTSADAEEFEYLITPEDTVLGEFVESDNKCYVPAEVGTYTVVMYSVKDGYFLSEESEALSVTVYNEESFTMPSILTIENDSDANVTITWSSAPTSCVSWYIKYQMSDGSMSSAIVVEEGVNTEFTDAKEFGAIIIYATYLPDDARDYIYLEGEAEEVIPAVAALAPVFAQPVSRYDADGNPYIDLSWSIASTEGIIRSVIYYADNSDSTLTYTELGINFPKLGENTYTLTAADGLTVGSEYNIYVRTQRDNADGTLSAISDAYDVLAYNSTYFTSASLPLPSANLDETLDESIYGEGYNVVVTWSGDALVYVENTVIEYDGVQYTSTKETDADGNTTVKTYFPYTVDVDNYSYISATFLPDGGETGVTVVYPGSTKPAIALSGPVAASDIAVTPMYDAATDASKIKLEWEYTSVADHFEILAATSTEAAVSMGTVDYDSMEVVVDEENPDATPVYKYTFVMDAVDGEYYTLYVKSVSKLGYETMATAVTATAYGTSVTFPESVVPEVKSIYLVSGGDGTAYLKWDNTEPTVGLQKLEVTYTLVNGLKETVEAEVNTKTGSISTTSLPNAAEGKTIDYTATYYQTGGEGEIVYTATSTIVVETASLPDEPTSLKITELAYDTDSGDPYVKLSWNAPTTGEAVSKYYIYVTEDGIYPDDDDYTYATTATSYTISFSEIGDYTVFVKAASAKDENFVVSEDYASVSFTAFNETSYSISDLPNVAASYNNGIVTIDWSNIVEDLQSVTITCGTSTYVLTSMSEGGTSTFNYMSMVDMAFTYTAQLNPTNATTTINIEGGSAFFTVSSADIKYNSSDDLYEIYTARGLASFADIVNGTTTYISSAAVGGTIDLTTLVSDPYANAKLMKTIDLSSLFSVGTGANWIPIGYSTYSKEGGAYYIEIAGTPYRGEFDGNGYVIENFYNNDSSVAVHGLFGCVTGATIKNVTIKDPVVNSGIYSGVLVGIVNGASAVSTIQDCKVISPNKKASITVNNTNFGVLIGAVNAETYAAEIVRCSNQLTGLTLVSSSAYTGGLIGQTYGKANITESFNTMNMNLSSQYSGALVGQFAGSYDANGSATVNMIGCYNTGSLTASYRGAGLVGTIGGSSSSSVYISGCYNTGNVTATADSVIGGLIGWFRYGQVAVEGCYNSGTITSSAGTYTTVGAFIGTAAGTSIEFTNCYNVNTDNGISSIVGSGNAASSAVYVDGVALSDGADVSAITFSSISELNSNVSLLNEVLTDYYYTAGNSTTPPTINAVVVEDETVTE